VFAGAERANGGQAVQTAHQAVHRYGVFMSEDRFFNTIAALILVLAAYIALVGLGIGR
jgi:hypothetical protein